MFIKHLLQGKINISKLTCTQEVDLFIMTINSANHMGFYLFSITQLNGI